MLKAFIETLPSLTWLFILLFFACVLVASGIIVQMLRDRIQSLRGEQQLSERLKQSAFTHTEALGQKKGSERSKLAPKTKTPFWKRPLFTAATVGSTQDADLSHSTTILCVLCLRSEQGRKLLHLMKQAGFEQDTEAYLQWWLVAVGLAILFALAFSSVVMAFTVLVLSTAASLAYLQATVDKRRQALRAALPDMLDELAQSLRAGRSFPQSLSFVLDAQPDTSPLCEILGRLNADAKLGRSCTTSLLQLSSASNLRELKSIAAVLDITSRVGGSTPALFEQAATSIRQDLMLNKKLKVQTAQGRSSVRLVGTVPFVLIGLMSLTMPGYLGLWLSSRGGQFLFALAMCLIAAGFFWVRSVVNIRV